MSVMSEMAMEQQLGNPIPLQAQSSAATAPVQEPTTLAPAQPEPASMGPAPKPAAATPAEETAPPATEPPQGAIEELSAPADEQADEKAAADTAQKAAEEEQKKQEHEAAEAKRKEAFEAKQAAKKAAAEARLAEIARMTPEELENAAVKHIGEDAERLTKRNMRNCVAEHIQTKCYEDADFAKLALHPKKNILNCFHYITRMAKDYAKKEMEETDQQPIGGAYGCDVPDGLCYKWAEDYYADMDCEEDKEKDDKFVPKPYRSTTTTTKSKTTKPKKKEEKKKPAEKKPATEQIEGQLTLGEVG